MLDEQKDINRKEEKMQQLQKMRNLMFSWDTDQSGSITLAEAEEGWDRGELQEILEDIQLPVGFTAEEFMYLLDRDGCKELTFVEFLTNFYRLLTGDSFQMNCCLHSSLNEVKTVVKDLQRDHMVNMQRQITHLRKEMKEEIAEVKQQNEETKQIMLSIAAGLQNSGVEISCPGINFSSEQSSKSPGDRTQSPLPSSQKLPDVPLKKALSAFDGKSPQEFNPEEAKDMPNRPYDTLKPKSALCLPPLSDEDSTNQEVAALALASEKKAPTVYQGT